jgi:hypothetical protein
VIARLPDVNIPVAPACPAQQNHRIARDACSATQGGKERLGSAINGKHAIESIEQIEKRAVRLGW